MPEGDTVHKLANFLAPRLAERTVQRLEMADAAAARKCNGLQVRNVRAQGKHLFIEFADDTALRSHLGMYGSWHRYAAGENWRKPRSQASLVIATDTEVFVCFNAKEVELVGAPSVRERILGARLGPDLAHADVDTGYAVARARALLDHDTILADVLLDQRAACGIGNVYKSEILFIRGHLPESSLGEVDDATLEACYSTASGLLRRNLGGGRRVTRFERDGAGRLWVYGRRGLPCLRCESRILTARLGRHHRSTYWCASCQS